MLVLGVLYEHKEFMTYSELSRKTSVTFYAQTLNDLEYYGFIVSMGELGGLIFHNLFCITEEGKQAYEQEKGVEGYD